MTADHPTTPDASPASRRDRAADLAALADYVRVLADRMGLKDWTFEVRAESPTIRDFFVHRADHAPPRAILMARDDFLAKSPEDRRLAIARHLVGLHFWKAKQALDHIGPTRWSEYTTEADDAAATIAAAWAPCLPLPLVGLMRRAGGARKEDKR